MTNELRQRISLEERYNFTAIDNEMIFDKRLNAYHKTILLFLNAVAINKDYSYYTQDDIALYCGIAKNTVCRYVKELIDLGYIEVQKVKQKNGFDKNIYHLVQQSKKKTMQELMSNYKIDFDEIERQAQNYHNDNPFIDLPKREDLDMSKADFSKKITHNIEIAHPDEFKSVINDTEYNIDSNCYEDKEYSDFLNKFVEVYNKITCSICGLGELRQVKGYKSNEKQLELKRIFDNRKTDYTWAIEKAYKESKDLDKEPYYKFLDFVDRMRVNLLTDNSALIKKQQEEIERQNRLKEQQEQERLLQEQKKLKEQQRLEIEAQKLGITPEELEDKETEDAIAEMHGMLNSIFNPNAPIEVVEPVVNKVDKEEEEARKKVLKDLENYKNKMYQYNDTSSNKTDLNSDIVQWAIKQCQNNN